MGKIESLLSKLHRKGSEKGHSATLCVAGGCLWLLKPTSAIFSISFPVFFSCGNLRCPVVHPDQVTVEDTSKIDRLVRELDHEKCRRSQAEMELIRLKVQISALTQQRGAPSTSAPYAPAPQHRPPLASVPQHCRAAEQGSSSDCATAKTWSTAFEAATSGSRVVQMASGMVLVSAAFPAAGAGGSTFGVTKISLADPRHSEAVRCHSQPVRDVKLGGQTSHPTLMLTTSLDKTLKVTDAATNRVVLSYELPRPGWSCEWSRDDGNVLYCGSLRGEVLLFDMRMTGSILDRFEVAGCNAPLHSLISLDKPVPRATPAGAAKAASGDSLSSPRSILLCGSLGGVWEVSHAVGAGTGDWSASPCQAALGGACVSLCASQTPSSFHDPLVVASTRGVAGPGDDAPAAHALFRPRSAEPEAAHLLRGHVCRLVMSRAAVWTDSVTNCAAAPAPISCAFVASGDESSGQVLVWNCATGGVVQRLRPHSTPVLMVQHMSMEKDSATCRGILASVSESELKVYRRMTDF